MKALVLTTAALLAVSSSAFAASGPAAETASQTGRTADRSAPIARIVYGDLDLSSVDGSSALDARVERSGRRACQALSRSIVGRSDCERRFREEAMAVLPTAAREEYARGRSARIEI